MAACGSENGRSDDAPKTADFGPFRTLVALGAYLKKLPNMGVLVCPRDSAFLYAQRCRWQSFGGFRDRAVVRNS